MIPFAKVKTESSVVLAEIVKVHSTVNHDPLLFSFFTDDQREQMTNVGFGRFAAGFIRRQKTTFLNVK